MAISTSNSRSSKPGRQYYVQIIFSCFYNETAWARYFASMIYCLSLKSSYTLRQWNLIWNWNNIMYDVIHNSVMTRLSCWKLPQSMNICSFYVNIRDTLDRNYELLLHFEARGFFPFFILLLLFEVHGKWVIVKLWSTLFIWLVHYIHCFKESMLLSCRWAESWWKWSWGRNSFSSWCSPRKDGMHYWEKRGFNYVN